METSTNLFIRTCKTDTGLERLLKVYKRFYGDYGDTENKLAIANILVSIVDEYAPLSLSHYFREVNSYKLYASMSTEDNHTETERTICICRDQLRRTSREQLAEHGYKSPLRWRNK